MSRRDPDALSWKLTPETVLPDIYEFHKVDNDEWFFEQWNEDAEEWELYHGPALRLTVHRAQEDD